MSREMARLLSVDADLQDRVNEIEEYKQKLLYAEEKLETKDLLVSS